MSNSHRRPGHRLHVSVLVVVLFCAIPAGGTEAAYSVRSGNLPISHSVNGYSQSVEVLGDGEVLVRVGVPAVAVGAAPGGFEPDPQVLAVLPQGFGLPERLSSVLSADLDAFTRATRVLRWVARSLSLNISSTGDQDAVSVLRRGNGRCSGLANATVALLRAAGFEARTVSGLLVSDDRVVPHRWLECLLPGAGWVPTDPTIGFWVVTPRHLVFSDTVTDLPVVEMVSPPEDPPHYPVIDGVPTRPDLGSELVCRVVNPCGGRLVAVLRGDSGVELRTELEKEGRFSLLFPGRWRLEVRRDSDVVLRQTLDLGNGEHYSVAVRIDDEDCVRLMGRDRVRRVK